MQSSRRKYNKKPVVQTDRPVLKCNANVPHTLQFLLKKYSRVLEKKFRTGFFDENDEEGKHKRYQEHVQCKFEEYESIDFKNYNEMTIESLMLSQISNTFDMKNIENIYIKKLVLYKCEITFRKLFKLLAQIKVDKLVLYDVDIMKESYNKKYILSDFGLQEVVLCRTNLSHEQMMNMIPNVPKVTLYHLNGDEYVYSNCCDGYSHLSLNTTLFTGRNETDRFSGEYFRIESNTCPFFGNTTANVKFLDIVEKDIHENTLDAVFDKLYCVRFINCRFIYDTFCYKLLDKEKFKKLKKVIILGSKTFFGGKTESNFLKNASELEVEIDKTNKQI